MSHSLPRRLSPMDAFFLYLERDEQPMHVGGICIFEGKLPYKRFVNNLDARMHLIPRYRQRAVAAPFNLGHPTWEDDPNFDINHHVFRRKVKAPGGDAQLRALATEVFTGVLDRGKPLWEVYFIEGLEDGNTALMFKVHHAMVDGVAGIGLAFVLLDVVPDPPKIRKPKFKPEPIPESHLLLQDALWDSAIQGIGHWARFQRKLVEFGEGFDSAQLAQAVTKFGVTMGGFLLPFRKMPFNQPLDGKRLVTWKEFAFTDVRAIRAVCGGTLNDVMLTILSGAVRRHLADFGGELLRKYRTFRVLIPVNVREESERSQLGNRISFLPVDIPIYLEDPVERLNAITFKTKDAKDARVPQAVSLMFEALQGAPALFQALSLGAVATPTVQNVLSKAALVPPANMICTNVPGPQIPLYSLGHRLLRMYPLLPVALEMGINCAITSYDQKLFVCLCADGQAGYDVETMARHFEESFRELRTAAEVKEAAYVKIVRGTRGETAPEPEAVSPLKAESNGGKSKSNGKPKIPAKPRRRTPARRTE